MRVSRLADLKVVNDLAVDPPSVLFEQTLWQIPVVESDEGSDVGVLEGEDEVSVEGDALLVDLAALLAGRNDPRPSERHPVRVDT